MSVCLSVSSSDFVSVITFDTIKGMWMKLGMWQYVDYARCAHDKLLWWVAVRCTSSCVVRRQCFECGHSRKPDCDEKLSKCLSRQYLGKVLIWLVQG